MRSSIEVWPDPKKGRHKVATRLLNWYATNRPLGASEDEIASMIWDPVSWLMVEKGIPETTTFGAPKSYMEMIFLSSHALPICVMSRPSSMLLTKAWKCVLISIHRSLAWCGIARSIARVVPPVPGPNSTIILDEETPAATTVRRSRKRELGITDPI